MDDKEKQFWITLYESSKRKGLQVSVIDCLDIVIMGFKGKKQEYNANGRIYCDQSLIYCPCQYDDSRVKSMKGCNGNSLYLALAGRGRQCVK